MEVIAFDFHVADSEAQRSRPRAVAGVFSVVISKIDRLRLRRIDGEHRADSRHVENGGRGERQHQFAAHNGSRAQDGFASHHSARSGGILGLSRGE